MARSTRRPQDNVFINCPFDDAYRPLFTASVFSVIASGFNARCALEEDDASKVRLDKIYEIIEECHFGIHDISRVELDTENNLPRFNMPLELGIMLGAKRYCHHNQERKALLIHDSVKYRYQKFLSDLAGMDVKQHSNDAAKVIANIHSMLRTNSRRDNIPTLKRMQESFVEFSKLLPGLSRSIDLDHADLLFADLENLVIAWVKKDLRLTEGL